MKREKIATAPMSQRCWCKVQGARCKFIIEQSMHPLHVMFTVVLEGQ